jgi:Protein of unknown function (DUF1569)
VALATRDWAEPKRDNVKTLARQRDRTEILRRLRQIRFDSAARWGRMTAPQMICHLSDAFRMVTGHKTVSHAASLPQRTIVKWIALYLPLRWPKGLDTVPEIDQELEGTRPADFAGDVAALEALVNVIAESRIQSLRHPIFGVMSGSAWRRWAYLHVDHHLRQFGE